MPESEMKAAGCPECGYPVLPHHGFCEACGVPLRGAASPAPKARARPAECVECGSTEISDGFCGQCGLRQPDGREHVEVTTPTAAGVSDRGRRHSRNEDAMAVVETGGRVIAVVCDGVSSAPRPEEASQIAAETGAAMLTAQLDAGADTEAATRAAVLRAGKAVAALAASEHEAPACTYVSAVVDVGAVTVGWVGDSRAYWISDGTGARPSTVLTADDSWAAQMVELGVLTPAQAHADVRAHTLTSWLGADAGELRPRVERFEPGGPGAVVLCTDGLWNYLPEAAELAEAVHRARAGDPARPPLEIAGELVRTALDAGGHDNVTVVLIPFPPPEADSPYPAG